MKNIVLTTLFAGCFAISSASAGDGAFKAGTFDFGAKLAVGASKGTVDDDGDKMKKTSPLIGIGFTTRYNVTDSFGIGGELFFDSFNYKNSMSNEIDLEGLKSLLKANGKNREVTENDLQTLKTRIDGKVKGRLGALITFSYSPLENMSFLFGMGVVKNRNMKCTAQISGKYKDGTEEKLSGSSSYKIKVAPIFKLGADYHYNKNLSFGLEGTYSKAKFDKMKDMKLINATIALTVKYTF